VIADPFDHSNRAAVSHCETLAGDAANESPTGRSAIKRDISDDDVFLGFERRSGRWKHDETSTRQAFTEVVVRIALERETDALRQESAEALTGRTREPNFDRVCRQAVETITPCDFASKNRPDRAIRITDRKLQFNRRRIFER